MQEKPDGVGKSQQSRPGPGTRGSQDAPEDGGEPRGARGRHASLDEVRAKRGQEKPRGATFQGGQDLNYRQQGLSGLDPVGGGQGRTPLFPPSKLEWPSACSAHASRGGARANTSLVAIKT